jgi:hypothetical protein
MTAEQMARRTGPEHASAVRRLDGARDEQRRLATVFQAAIGTAAEPLARERLSAGRAYVAARLEWLHWIDEGESLAPWADGVWAPDARRDVEVPLAQPHPPAQPLHNPATPPIPDTVAREAAAWRPTGRPRYPDAHQGESRSVTAPDDLEQLRAEATYRHQRLALYRAKAYGSRPTTAVRLRELEREYELAASRLKHAAAAAPHQPRSS